MVSIKDMPIGVTDFKEVREECYFVDKTRVIKEILEDRSKVILLTRPRRFGKTLLLSMLDYFFAIDRKEESEHLFDGLAIEREGGKYMAQRGSRPVIFLSLKGLDAPDWATQTEMFCHCIQSLYKRYYGIWDSGKLRPNDQAYAERILNREASAVDCQAGLYHLSEILESFYGVKPILLLDEYDAPIQSAYDRNYYDDCICFYRSCFNAAFKDNSHLDFAVLTGVLRVAKESIFSGLNNLHPCPITEEDYADACGFTLQEVQKLAEDVGLAEKLPEIREWYDGYLFGGKEIYNPWSVINYIHSNGKPNAYWMNTSANGILKKLLRMANEKRMGEIRSLLDGEPVWATLDEGQIYDNIGQQDNDLYNMLFTTGYLTMSQPMEVHTGDVLSLKLPNKEIRMVYAGEILSYLTPRFGRTNFLLMLKFMLEGKGEAFARNLQQLILEMVSNFDTGDGKGESFYHGLMLGFVATLHHNGYQVKSEGESGYGRFDVGIFPEDKENPGVLLEFKAVKKRQSLARAAQAARKQIETRSYVAEFAARGVAEVWKYGIAFRGKEVVLAE